MKDVDQGRRGFLLGSAAVAGSRWATLVLPSLAGLSVAASRAFADAQSFSVLTADEAAEFEAIAERILPATDTPGAKDVGVVHFFDQTFGSFNAPMLMPARGGLGQFLQGIDGGSFAALTAADQDAYLETQEATPFFGMLRFLTLCGYFGMSKYGGNRDGAGWELVGMTPNTHAYQSPFGYYDAEYLKENPNG